MTTRWTTGAQVTGNMGGRADVHTPAKTGPGARSGGPRKAFQLPGKRHGVAWGCVGLALAAVAGCSAGVVNSAGAVNTISAVPDRRGFAAAPVTATSAPPTHALADQPPPTAAVPANKIDSLLLSPAQASAVARTPLGHQELMTTPMPAASLGDHADCAVLVQLNDQTVGHDYMAFRSSRLTDDGDDSTSYLFQTVATYADAATAARTFHASFNQSLLSCNGVVGQDQQRTFDSTFEVEAVTADSAQWISTPLVGGTSVGFNCAYEARVQDNVLFGVRLCQPGEGASAATTLMAQQISDQVSEIAGN
jgi:PknH-like extracellular domain